MAGTTLKQRLANGKGLAPLANGLIPWGRQSDGAEFVMTAQQMTDLVNQLSAAATVTAQAGATYTADVNDAYTIIEFTGATAHAFSLPSDAAAPLIGLQTVIQVVQIGTGALSFPAGAGQTTVGGVTYDIPTGLTVARFVPVSWRKRAANEWIAA